MRASAALAGAAFAAAGCAAMAQASALVAIPAGLYTPFQRVKTQTGSQDAPAPPQPIGSFRLQAEPVTNAEFLAFVTAHPDWRKSRIKPLFADGRYLRRWAGDLKPADVSALDEPVTNVSWFAAEAYCRAQGLRLPTTEQWEYGLADAGRGQGEVRARSLEWFSEPNGARPNRTGGPANGFGLRDTVGLVWEWTLDFSAYATTAESRDADGKDSAGFCGGAAAGVADPTDYPAFMRYSMRASLKADYTADNLGFRCAGGAP
jgi:formylglycine-generating enzyme required for sulfatase activity